MIEDKKYQNIIDNSPDFVFESRVDNFQFTKVNKRACEFYGYTNSEFMKMNIFDIEVNPPLKTEVQQLYENSEVGYVLEVYGINKKKDGSIFPVHVRFSKISDELALANVRDITELKKKEMELERYQYKLEQTNKSLEMFASTVAHDMKAPLNSVLGLVDLVEMELGIKGDKKIVNYIKLLKDINHQAKDLIDGILEYSKDSFSTLNLRRVDLAKLIAKVTKKYKSDNNIVIDMANSLPVVKHYETALTQIFNNLIDNAIKYNDKRICEIYLDCVEKSDHYEVSISDNGPGIAESNRKKIFNLFENLKNKKKHSTGIGLAIVKKILQESKGRIWIDTSAKKGAKFIFTIKKQKDHQKD